MQWDGARGRRAGGRALEQRYAVGQVDGYSLVAIDYRQTIQQGNNDCFLLSTYFHYSLQLLNRRRDIF